MTIVFNKRGKIMKKLTLMTLLALTGISFSASAYNYTVVNKTNQKITVSIISAASTTYSWVLAPSGTTIPASQAASSSLVVPPGIDDIPGAEFGDTHVFKFTGIDAKLCLSSNFIDVNGKVVDAVGGPAGFCGDKTVSILQRPDGKIIASVD